MHDPGAAEDVVETAFEVLLEVTSLLVVDVFKVLEGFAVLEVVDFTVLEILIVLVAIDEVFKVLVRRTLLVLVFAHASWICPISHTPFLLKDSKRMLLIAFKFAPEKELNGTVYVWVDPVMPVREV